MGIDKTGQPAPGEATMQAGSYLDAVASGFGHMKSCLRDDIGHAQAWLCEQGIRYFASNAVFAFKTRADAARFAERFGSR